MSGAGEMLAALPPEHKSLILTGAGYVNGRFDGTNRALVVAWVEQGSVVHINEVALSLNKLRQMVEWLESADSKWPEPVTASGYPINILPTDPELRANALAELLKRGIVTAEEAESLKEPK